ncbi:MAG: metallophosphoesterase [Desulfobacterales bacterium]|nr:metallophosphoesterase [Desulfobacterales bacterium]
MLKKLSYPGIQLCLAVIAVLASVALSTSVRAESHPLSFVQITDTHMGVLDHDQRTEKIVSAVNRLRMDIHCVVHTGDITEEKILEPEIVSRGKAILGKVKYPLHYISGNNDIRAKNVQPTAQAYEAQYGPLIQEVRYRDVIFLFAYTEPLAKGFEMEGYDPMAQVEKRLKAAGKTPVLLFHHTPCVGKLRKGKLRSGWDKTTREKWIALLNRYSVKAVFAGHFHQDEQHWLGDIPLYVAPPVSSRFGRQAAFRVYTYHQGRISYRTQYIQ